MVTMVKMRLMLVDDEERFLQTTGKMIRKKGYDVITATSGEECLEKLEEELVHVVILDVKMPGMDGIETLKQIKREFPLVEVIMLTGHATVESAIEGMKLGAFDYLMKPSDIDLLVEKVTEAAAKKRRHEEKIIEAEMRKITTRGR
jgi:DNA-binding NtrC family response regulator